MKIETNTKILTLTNEFPFLIDDLAEHNRTFEKLKNPVMRQAVGRIASIEKAAAIGKEDTLDLMLFIAGKIMATAGKNVEIVPPAPQSPPKDSGPLSDEQRMASMKQIIHDLHDGADMQELKERFAQTVGDISHQEVAALEQGLVKDGMPETEIKKMCDLHVELLQEPLAKRPEPLTLPGHPVHTYMEENSRAAEYTGQLLLELNQLGEHPPENVWAFAVQNLNRLLHKLEGILVHYVRKENQLFPMLERHGIDAPPKIMWEVHDDIRAKYRKAAELIKGQDRDAAAASLRDLATIINDMILKEERVLFPMTLNTLDEADWVRSRKGDDEIGYGFGVVPGNEWQPVERPESPQKAAQSDGPSNGIDLSTGVLPLEVLNTMLCNLPVDMSFVDADNKVAYYSDSSHRIFPRSPEVIGRDVKNCHPPKSVHIVTEILESFQCGKRNKAEFWLELGGKFIHIQYLALRGSDRQYLGCLEVGQDATYLRSLNGEQRLLEWT